MSAPHVRLLQSGDGPLLGGIRATAARLDRPQ